MGLLQGILVRRRWMSLQFIALLFGVADVWRCGIAMDMGVLLRALAHGGLDSGCHLLTSYTRAGTHGLDDHDRVRLAV